MIGIITQNNTVFSCLRNILTDYQAQKWTQDTLYDAVLLVAPLPASMPHLTTPIITLGLTYPNESLHITTPVLADTLRQRIDTFLKQNQKRPTFENRFFLFQGRTRSLQDKETGNIIQLTEKENALLCCLATASPETLSKDKLLTLVWNYHPETETHTLESHIYALRQKIGPKADFLIQNTPSGYYLITN